MLLLYAKYAFVFWLLIGKNNGDLLLHGLTQDETLFEVTGCTAKCLQTQRKLLPHQQLSFKTCYDNCKEHLGVSSNQRSKTEFLRIQENLNLKLLCRSHKSLTFRIDFERSVYDQQQFYMTLNNTTTTNTSENNTYNDVPRSVVSDTNLSDIVFIVEIHVRTNADVYTVFLSDDNIITIENLKQNTTHNITAVAIHANNQYSVIAKQQQFTTLKRFFQPADIANVQVTEFIKDPERPMHVMARIEWKPSADKNCDYSILYFPTQNMELGEPIEIRSPQQLYSYKIDNLELSSEYNVGVRSRNSFNGNESKLLWNVFNTPSCLDWFNYNLSICAPPEPSNLSIEEQYLSDNELSLNITWSKPKYAPDYYQLRILDLDKRGKLTLFNITKDSDIFVIPKIYIYGTFYEIHLTAYTRGGNATTIASFAKATKLVHIKDNIDTNNTIDVVMIIIVPVFSISTLVMILFLIYTRKSKLKRYQERSEYLEKIPTIERSVSEHHIDIPSMSMSSNDLKQSNEHFWINDEMEIDRKDLTLHEILGEGAFGLVRRGQFQQLEVAVKMLRDEPTMDDVRAFKCEMEVMKAVGKHPNIVGIVGYYTKSISGMMLLTEFCSLGSLQSFLREEWKYVHEERKRAPKSSKTPATITRQERKNNDLRKQIWCRKQRFDRTTTGKINTKSNPKSSINCIEIKNGNFDNTTQHIEDVTYATTTITTTTAPPPPPPTTTVQTYTLHNESPPQTCAANNKSYGYSDTFCFNSCKCEVDVIIQNFDGNIVNDEAQRLEKILQENAQQMKTTKNIIDVKNCECRKKRNEFNYIRNKRDKEKKDEHKLVNTVDNREYFIGTSNEKYNRNEEHKNRQRLQNADLIEIARQVAQGMEYLAKNKVVHRDLAARNVLVTSDRTIKIADFGLSRDIYHENIYKKTGGGKLPLKWMALESLTHQVYTSQSDVWSYGILLFEIATMGGTPYPSIPSNRLLSLLRTGYRMKKPVDCNTELYNLMLSCWRSIPAERPTFTDIIKALNEMLSDDAKSVDYVREINQICESANESIEELYLNPVE